MVSTALLDEIIEQIESMNDNQIECRDMGHSWKAIKLPRELAEELSELPEGVARLLQCSRCKGKRYEILSLNGEILKRNYRMSEGYRMATYGTGRVRVARFRQEWIERSAA